MGVVRDDTGDRDLEWIYDVGPTRSSAPPTLPSTPRLTSGNRSGVASRQAPFGASEHVRLLQVLVDVRMVVARQQLFHRRTRDGKDCVPVDPWDEQVVVLFNDVSFNPRRVPTFPGGVTMSDIEDIDPHVVR